MLTQALLPTTPTLALHSTRSHDHAAFGANDSGFESDLKADFTSVFKPASDSATDNTPTTIAVQCMLTLLDRQAEGLAVVDGDARVVYANRLAHHTLSRYGWLQRPAPGRVCRVESQRALTLASPRAPEQAQWLHTLHAACKEQIRSMLQIGDATKSESSTPDTPNTLSPRFIAVSPLPLANTTLALVSLGRAQLCGLLELHLFAKRFRLSAAECEVLQHLSEGLKPVAIARLHGVELCTVNSQLAAIREKTGCNDVRELLLKIACLPAVCSATLVAGLP